MREQHLLIEDGSHDTDEDFRRLNRDCPVDGWKRGLTNAQIAEAELLASIEI